MGDDDHPIEELTVFAVTGAGLVGLFVGVDWFWAIWVLGYAVLLPAMSVVSDNYLGGDESEDETAEDPLAALRERYANGELTEAEFERKVERLLATEDRETARELDIGEPSAERDRDRQFET